MTILSVFFEVISPKHIRACSSSKRWPRSLQTARCSLQTARGFQIAWNISNRYNLQGIGEFCALARAKFHKRYLGRKLILGTCSSSCKTLNSLYRIPTKHTLYVYLTFQEDASFGSIRAGLCVHSGADLCGLCKEALTLLHRLIS